ncbi:hypothetical protein [Rhodococcus sp. IEGM1428]|uniref:hypothetical protein n=1 Tax=Rhodococcus sp. IEGM1428 TaxID=3392191 RepID=UPI003D0B1AD5
MTTWTTVDVDYHLFSLAAAHSEPVPPGALGELIDASDNCIHVHTGIASGPVRVAVDVLAQAPAVEIDGSWEDAAEVSIAVDATLTFVSALGYVGTDATTVSPPVSGFLGVRVSSIGRGTHRDSDVSEPVEDYLFEIWPATMRRELTRVKTTNGPQTSKPGSVRPPSTSTSRSNFDPYSDATVRLRGPVSWDPEEA